ncbi:MAG: UDP-N-acetylmuramoyl-L-alanine--D-glutamate ligase [Rhodospirillales bacterium]
MIDLASLQGSRFAVVGLARSGLATARALQASGIEHLAWDDDAAKRSQAAASGLNVADPKDADWSRIDALLLSPGIAHTYPAPHPLAALARSHGKPILGDIELLMRAISGEAQGRPRFVGITGTNGKSTTTALIGHVLQSAGKKVEIGGNLGRPALDFAALGKDDIYVLEMSSYQLELIEQGRFDVAVLLNITPDHLDRHGGMAGYIAAKRRIFLNQRASDAAVVGIDSAPTRDIAAGLVAAGQRVIPISVGHKAEGGVWAIEGTLHDDIDGTGFSFDLKSIFTLPGAHNWQNACAAYATCRALGLSPQAIATGIKTYPGLAHRQERIGVLGGIPYINDSKATNADASEKALSSYDTIYWIAGGRPKEGGIESLAPLFGRVVHAFLIGEAADEFAATLQDKVPFEKNGDLAHAVQAAHVMAQREHRPHAVVLLSPACASFDQWPNFEARGDGFRALVKELGPALAGKPTGGAQ